MSIRSLERLNSDEVHPDREDTVWIRVHIYAQPELDVVVVVPVNVLQTHTLNLRQVTALQGETLVDFSAGVNHSVAVNEFGEVFSWGRGREGQLGLGVREDYLVRQPERVALLDEHMIKKVSCGDAHTIALSVTGEVFMWGLLPETRVVKNDGMFDHASVSLAGMQADADGDNASDFMTRLLRGSEELYEAQNMTKHDLDDTESSLAHLQSKKLQTIRHSCFAPRLVSSLLRQRITNIAAGFAHSLAVSDEGIVFSCGYNDNGQLGIGSRRNSADFERVKNLEEFFITQVACGQQHSMACSRLDPFNPRKSGICFSWGLGILGQLGLGINISWLPMEVHIDKPVISIAAGSHHSVAVTDDNKVYTWGHSEYGQHGSGEQFRDLQRGLYYFFPRIQEYLDSENIKIEKVSCSSHSTFALSNDGSVYSWGWNAFGVLGNGKYQHTVDPQPLSGLKGNVAFHVGAGANHGALIVRPRGCHYSLKYDKILKDGDFFDLEFVVGGGSTSLKAHQVIVSARSPYLRGMLRIIRETATLKEEDGRIVLIVEEFSDVDVQVFRAFLGYIYTNRLDVVFHKRTALKAFAERVCADTLAKECELTWRKQRPIVDSSDDSKSDDVRQFEEDMHAMVLSPEYADVEFLWPGEVSPVGSDYEESKSDDIEYVRLAAHKAILSQVEYFHTMFAGGFSEGQQDEQGSGGAKRVHQIALHHMPQDGISLSSFKALLAWIYAGSIYRLRQLEPSEMMDLYVAASLVGLTVLAAQCEMLLIDLLPSIEDDAASLQACLDFAAQFDARRLKSLSQRSLELWHGVTPEPSGSDVQKDVQTKVDL